MFPRRKEKVYEVKDESKAKMIILIFKDVLFTIN